jgi:hypothetical protein
MGRIILQWVEIKCASFEDSGLESFRTIQTSTFDQNNFSKSKRFIGLSMERPFYYSVAMNYYVTSFRSFESMLQVRDQGEAEREENLKIF